MKDFFSPTAQARHHTVLHPPTSPSLPEKTILPLHPLEIRDLNGGVSSEKMDRTQLMCFFPPSLGGNQLLLSTLLHPGHQSNEP